MKAFKLLPILFFIVIASAYGKTVEDCRSDVTRAVQGAGSDDVAMMRAGDRALSECMSQKTERSGGSYIAWGVVILILGAIIIGALTKGKKEEGEEKSSTDKRLKESAENEIRKEKLKSEKRGWLSFEGIEKKGDDVEVYGPLESKYGIDMQSHGKISQEEIEEINKQGGINQVDEYGNTFLHYACYYSNYSIFKQLIELGSDVRITNNLNDTALHYMMYFGIFQDDTLKIMQELFDNGLVLDESMVHIEDAIMVGVHNTVVYAFSEDDVLDGTKEIIDEIPKIIKILRINDIPVSDKPINNYLEHISTPEFKVNEANDEISKACN